MSLGQLREKSGRYLPRGEGFPAAKIALRSSSPDSVAVVESEAGEVIGSVETARAHSALHPGAIYLHMGRSYEVDALDTDSRRALVRPFAGDFYTQPKKEIDTYIESVSETREVAGVPLSFGTVSVTEQVTAFQRKRVADHEVLDLVALDMPEQHFATQALWYEFARAGAGRRLPARRAPGLPPRCRARADRRAAADRDVRPLGHRRAVHRLPLADRAPHDLHLRRPSGRRGHHAHGLRALRAAGAPTRCG